MKSRLLKLTRIKREERKEKNLILISTIYILALILIFIVKNSIIVIR